MFHSKHDYGNYGWLQLTLNMLAIAFELTSTILKTLLGGQFDSDCWFDVVGWLSLKLGETEKEDTFLCIIFILEYNSGLVMIIIKIVFNSRYKA